MRYVDRIYGPTDIDEPVLLALFQSHAVQRLQGVLQHGISGLVGITLPTSRFEHSVGVMLLVRRYGGSLKEQIAALLHDVSHTTFSHVIDYVFDSHDSQNYHERVKAQYMSGTDLPAILGSYGYDWRDFIHEEGYDLLEQPLPDLCADRLDYFLRDSIDLKLTEAEKIAALLQHLQVHQGQFVVDDIDTARWLAYTYIAADATSWANPREVGLYEVTARAIRLALNLGVISEDDFWGTDQQFWEKLHTAQDPELKAQLRLASAETQFVQDEIAPTFHVSTKLRAVDPKVLCDGKAQPLSAIDPDFAAYRSHYLTSNQGKRPMRVVSP